jgi:DNA-directed RNA polymerase subunit H (RpoH/RPB5)
MNTSHLVSSFNVILEMLEDRGFKVDDARESYSETELINIYMKSTASSIVIESGDKKARIFYLNLVNLRKHAKSYPFDKDTVPLHIIIFTEKTALNPNGSKSLLEAYKQAKFKCNLFHWDEVVINKSKHHLVPKHELITKEQEQSILEQYNATKTQLPWIQRTDPMARYLGLEPGQIIRIKYASPTAGEYFSYCTCV